MMMMMSMMMIVMPAMRMITMTSMMMMVMKTMMMMTCSQRWGQKVEEFKSHKFELEKEYR